MIVIGGERERERERKSWWEGEGRGLCYGWGVAMHCFECK